MAITKEVLDELLKDYKGPEDITGTDGLLKQLTKALVERAMDAEMTMHLGYEKSDQAEKNTTNRRNGKTRKTYDPIRDRSKSRYHAIGKVNSSRRSCLSISAISRALTTRSYRCTPAA